MISCVQRPSTAPNGAYSMASYSLYPGNGSQQAGSSRYHATLGKSISSGHVYNVRRPSDPAPGVIRARANTSSKDSSRTGAWSRENKNKIQHESDAKPVEKPLDQPTQSNSKVLNSPQSNSTAPCSSRSDPMGGFPFIVKESPPSSLDEFPSPPRQNITPTGPCHSRPSNRTCTDKEDKLGHLQQEAFISDEVARLEAETDRILASQPRTKCDWAQVQKPALSPPKSVARPIYQKLTSFTRAVRSKTLGQLPDDFHAATIRGNAHGTRGSARSGRETIKPEVEQLRHMTKDKDQSGGDSKSIVTIKCLSITFQVPITRDTLPRDIAVAAAGKVPTHIKPDICVVLEFYEEQGLKRPLRQYERIHDVVETWGREHDNSFIILLHTRVQDLADLRLSSVSSLKSPPTGFAFQLYHSSQPGNWNKYWVTLSETGQVFATNQPSSQPIIEHTIPLCHLSVCDIYTASEDTKVRFQLPAKFCFVIRKQIPSNSSREDDDYVHLFSTDIEQLADRFYELIQRWRSWYIAHDKGGYVLGNKASSNPPGQSSGLQKAVHPASAGNNDSELRVVSSSVIAKWSPLLDLNQFDKSIDQFGSKVTASPEIISDGISEPKTTKVSPTSPQQTVQQVDSKSSPEAPQDSVVPTPSEPGTAPAMERTRSSETSLSNVPDKSQPSSPISLPELNMAQPWFPSAVEHSTRQRRYSRRLSQRRPGTARTPTLGRQRNLKSCLSAPQKLEIGHLMRSHPGVYDVNGAVNPAPRTRPPPVGLESKQAARGRRFYKRPLRSDAPISQRPPQTTRPPIPVGR